MSTGTTRVLEALCDALVGELDANATPETRAACRRFIAGFHAGMQPLYRLAFAILAGWLEIACLAACGKTFTRASEKERAAAVGRWRRSRIGPKRDFVRLLLILTLTALYDSEELTGRLGIERGAYLATLSFYSGGRLA